MARKNPELNLAPELPQVTSRDFNLFYTPQAPRVDASISAFTQSLDNFVNGAGFQMAQVSERKLKQSEEAEAVKAFNENKLSFKKAVESGSIPKEANPYFINKYQELDLNSKANEFKGILYKAYADKNVRDNLSPNAFDEFYDAELKQYVASKQLSSFDAVALEKGFFSKTSGTREQLFQNHVSSQMSKIGEEFKIRFTENVQVLFDKNKPISEIGSAVSDFVKSTTGGEGLSNATAREYLMTAITDYISTTDDLDFAQKLVSQLPQNIQLGTDVLFNVKALENDFAKMKLDLQDRILKKEKDDLTRRNNILLEEKFDATEFVNEFDTFSEAINDPRYNSFSNSKKDIIFKEFESREQGFDTQTDPRIEPEINKLLKEGKFNEALELLDKNISNVTQPFYLKQKENIKSFKFTEKDGLLASDYYLFFKNQIDQLASKATSGKFNLLQLSELEADKFEGKMRQWLSQNPLSNFNNANEREDKFEQYVKQQYDKFRSKVDEAQNVSFEGNVGFSNQQDDTPIIVNPDDIPE